MDQYQIFYQYHQHAYPRTSDRIHSSLRAVLDVLNEPESYQDFDGQKYKIGINKNNVIWHSLDTVRNVKECLKRYLEQFSNDSIISGIYSSTYNLDITNMAAKRGFEYTVILHAIPVKDNSGNDVTPDSTIIIQPTTVIAVDEAHVNKIASRKIDTKISDSDLGRVEIKVRAL